MSRNDGAAIESGQELCCDGGMSSWNVRESNGAVLDVLTDDENGYRLTVNRRGGEMIGLEARDAAGEWKGFLYRDGEAAPPASGWANHATVMGYFLHRLWQEKSLYRGHLITGGNHSFLRNFDFDAPVAEDGALTYSVPADRVPPTAYPLKVSLKLSYGLGPEGVRIAFAFTNEEPELEAHVSFGIHPGFAVASVEEAKILFPAGTYVRHLAPGNFLSGETVQIEHEGGEAPFPKADLPGSFILGLPEVAEGEFLLEDPAAGRRVRLDFSEVPYLTLWSDMHPFICIEPCWGLPDSNPPTAFEDKPGIQVIPVGGVLRKSFGIKPEFLS